MNKIGADALNWAMVHLRDQGDTDLFPRPFEIDAVAMCWDDFKTDVWDIDITNHTWQTARSLLIPKDDLSFRNACQLDPLDTLLFAAIIREVGELIEKARIPKGADTVFSYRFSPTAEGRFYEDVNAWHAFWTQSLEHTQSGRFDHVLVTDVSDFYNQIYHHTIEQQLDKCGVPKPCATAIMHLLEHLTVGVSRGIPVGPHSAHMLAELAMIPLDSYLRLKGFTFCRYADDIHLFCRGERKAHVAAFEIAHILNVQKLQINREKSKIMTSDEFAELSGRMLLDNPINQFERELLDLIKARVHDPYAEIKITDLTPADLEKVSEPRLTNILESYLKARGPNYPRLRWVLRRLSQIGAPGGVDFVIGNFERLLPCLADAAGYLRSATDNYSGDWNEVGGTLLENLDLPIVKTSEYLQVVTLGLFARLQGLDHIGVLVDSFASSSPSARRKIILAATQAQASSWLSGLKTAYGAMDPWQKRALLYGAKTFSKDERKYWYKIARAKGTMLDAIVMKYADKMA